MAKRSSPAEMALPTSSIHSQANDASVFLYAFDLLSINGVTLMASLLRVRNSDVE
jgi:ATP-dependent DNA ligase